MIGKICKGLVGFLLLAFIHLGCMLDREPPLVELSTAITDKLADTEGTYAVVFADLKTGDTLFINANLPFPAASTIKTPVMIELYKQSELGILSLDDSVLVKTEFNSVIDGSSYQLRVSAEREPALFNKIGARVLINELIFEMITRSSNLATNLLLEIVGGENITRTMRELGAPDITILRGFDDLKADENNMLNETTAFDLLKVYEALGKDEIISESACRDMLEILLAQKFNNIIPAKLPKELKIAHKTGAAAGARHDTGIIILPNGHEYVLILLSKDLPSREIGIEVLSEISLMVYKYVIADKHQLH